MASSSLPPWSRLPPRRVSPTLALSDHDAIDGLEAAARAAQEAGIKHVPAVEMSCAHPIAEELHMLGYWVDPEAIAPACEQAQAERVKRAEEIVANLNAAGVEVTLEGAIAQAGDAASVGRPHIAKAAGATEMKPFFEKYLIPGTPTYVPRRWPTTVEAARLIHDAGGVAVLAHPFWDLDEPATVQDLVEELDLEGVEVFYPSHDREQVAFLVDLCRERGLSRPAPRRTTTGPTTRCLRASAPTRRSGWRAGGAGSVALSQPAATPQTPVGGGWSTCSVPSRTRPSSAPESTTGRPGT